MSDAAAAFTEAQRKMIGRFEKDFALKYAGEHRMLEQTFRLFMDLIYPTAGPNQIEHMRVAFFTGASELISLCFAALDDGVEATRQDDEFFAACLAELDAFRRERFATLAEPVGDGPPDAPEAHRGGSPSAG